MVLGGSCPGGNRPRFGCPMGVIVLRGSCPQGSYPRGSCPRGSCPRGSCPRGSCPVTVLVRWRVTGVRRGYCLQDMGYRIGGPRGVLWSEYCR